MLKNASVIYELMACNRHGNPQPLDQSRKAYYGQTLQLITATHKLQMKKSFVTLDPDIMLKQ